MFSLVSATVLRSDQVYEKKGLLTVLPWTIQINAEQQEICLALDDAVGCTMTVDENGENTIFFVKNCKWDAETLCTCDKYMNDEPLFKMNCQDQYNNLVGSGWCDEGEYGDKICVDKDYYEHGGCKFSRNSEKDSECESGITPPQQPNPSEINNFFQKILEFFNWLFGG